MKSKAGAEKCPKPLKDGRLGFKYCVRGLGCGFACDFAKNANSLANNSKNVAHKMKLNFNSDF